MSRVQYSPEQLKKLGLIETDKGFVKASSLVAKPKDVVKFKSAIISGPIKYGFPPSLAKLIDEEIEISNGITVTTPSVTTFYFCLPSGEWITPKYTFDICPCPAPRMTQSDRWKTDPFHPEPRKRQRPPVTRYFAWRSEFNTQCKINDYELTEVLRVVFIVPMPDSWSKKKKQIMFGQKHQQKPDTDNFIKSVKDSFKVDDGFVWDERGIKVWGEKGQIIIF